jgi:hypothetical protein
MFLFILFVIGVGFGWMLNDEFKGGKRNDQV